MIHDSRTKKIPRENSLLHFSRLLKNLVDSQVMLGHLNLDGFTIAESAEDAEVIIVNTCSFVEAAKVESIETVLDLAAYKEEGNCKALVMSGCMATTLF